ILNREHPSALFGRYSCHVPQRLDLAEMRRAASMLVGRRDFAAWANETSEARTTIRTVACCGLRGVKSFLLLRVEADGFLRGMVRNIVGTLLEVGVEKRPADDIERITESKDRTQAGPSAPAKGLCLVRVRY